ncbi:MAG: 16S rRNA (guanine966-N2)-methyltransferase [Acidimicrobiales bacterium]|jgi:16S rRNA (guanine966-N2)-methyltransferase
MTRLYWRAAISAELVSPHPWAATAGHTGAVRIVAGSARGRRLVVPDGLTTRPTTDRVREATFNALFSLDAIEDASFVDLFAGSGALGLEALSRGAAHATFVERDRGALAAVRKNIETLGFDEQATVVAVDSMRWIATAGHHDVVVADPPYGFDEWDALLATAKAGLIVAESNNPIEIAEPWEIVRERTYGSTVVTIVSGPDFGS